MKTNRIKAMNKKIAMNQKRKLNKMPILLMLKTECLRINKNNHKM